MGIVSNVVGSGVDSALLKRYVDETVKLEWANQFPLLTLLRALKRKEAVDQAKVEWVERTIYPQQVGVDGTFVPTATVIKLDSGHAVRIRASDILFDPTTEEKIRVLATAAGSDTVTVSRGYAGTTAGTLTPATTLVIMNAVQTEKGSPPEPRYQEAFNMFNFLEIFEEKYALSDLDRILSRYAIENHEKELEREAYSRLLLQIEKALFLGDRHDDGANDRDIKMGGLKYFVSTNVLNTTTLSWSAFNDTITAAIKRGAEPEKLVLFAGDVIIGGLRKWVEGVSGYEIRLEVADTVFGSQIHKIAVPGYGVIDIVRHPLFGDAYLNIPGWGFLVHLPDVKLAYGKGRDIQLIDIPNTEARAKQKKWSAYYSLICANEYHHAVFKNIKAISTA